VPLQSPPRLVSLQLFVSVAICFRGSEVGCLRSRYGRCAIRLVTRRCVTMSIRHAVLFLMRLGSSPMLSSILGLPGLAPFVLGRLADEPSAILIDLLGSPSQEPLTSSPMLSSVFGGTRLSSWPDPLGSRSRLTWSEIGVVFSDGRRYHFVPEVVLTQCSYLFVDKQTERVSNFVSSCNARLYEFRAQRVLLRRGLRLGSFRQSSNFGDQKT
jgi:hypothetical protein